MLHKGAAMCGPGPHSLKSLEIRKIRVGVSVSTVRRDPRKSPRP
jgi:hypothetical protein